jgi:hypothetical protein
MLSRYCNEKIRVRKLKVALAENYAGVKADAADAAVCPAKSLRANFSDAAMTVWQQ